MKLNLLGTAAAAALLFPITVWSAPVLTIVPSAPSVVVGSSVSVDIVASGLGTDQIVSAFDLNVLYDATFLSATGTTFKAAAEFGGTDPVFGDNWAFDTSGSSAGDAAGTGYSLADDATLQALQGDSFTLFTITFATLKAGTVQLDFGTDPFFQRAVAGLGGLDLPSLTFTIGDVEITPRACVGNGCNVPEPESYGLVAVGLLAAGLASRGRRHAKKGTVLAA